MLKFVCSLGVGLAGVYMTTPAVGATIPASSWVYPGPTGRLLYRSTLVGDRVPDFSTCGYRGGQEPIPDVPVKVTIGPVAGSDDANIQSALNRVSALPLDRNGFRGAVLLEPGEYDVTGIIMIRASGVVLRGSGTNATILRARGTGQRTPLQVAGWGSRLAVPGTLRNVTDKYVPVGARSFRIDNPTGLFVHDRIVIHRPATTNWIEAVGMDTFGWKPGQEDKYFERVITGLEGDRVTIDAVLPNSLDQRYGGGRIWKYQWPERIFNVGIENLRGISDFDPAITMSNPRYPGGTYYADMDHPNRFIALYMVEHAWIRNVIGQHFGSDTVYLTESTSHVTVERSHCLEPVSEITGGWRYAFNNFGQLNLVKDCYNQYGRHSFAEQNTSEGPNAFVNCRAETNFGESGPRHRWTTAALYDNLTVTGNNIHVKNWGLSFGRGLTGANCVVWNCTADEFVVVNPPTAQNWLIGGIGAILANYPDAGPRDPGVYDSPGARVAPGSLYYAQLQQRLAHPDLAFREYWLGDIDHYTRDGLADNVPSDPLWRAELSLRFPEARLAGFDESGPEQIVPFTFVFDLGPDEEVRGASLTLRLQPSVAPPVATWLYLDNSSSLASDNLLLPITDQAVVVDLSQHLDLLRDGRFNVATVKNAMIDWAVLNLETAPRMAAVSARTPEASTDVLEDPTNNSFPEPAPLLQTSGAAGTSAETFLRFDLTGLSPALTQAKVQLWPVQVAGRAEHGAALVPENSWVQTGLSWATKPLSGAPFAEWQPRGGVPVEFDVTRLVKEALLADRKLSLRLFDSLPAASSLVRYASAEYEAKELRPRLILFTQAPTISAIPAQRTLGDQAVGPIAFSVRDAESPADTLTVQGASSNPALLPDSNIILGGSGSDRTVTLLPAPDQTGLAKVTLRVTDTDGASSSRWFLLTVYPFTDRDTDGDGMSDQYELVLGLDPLDPRDAGLDPDGDGFTNLQEHQARTDPTQASSAFRVTDVAWSKDGLVVIFPTAPDRLYRLERSARVSPFAVETTVITNLHGSGRPVRITDPLGRSAKAGFYRVAVSPLP